MIYHYEAEILRYIHNKFKNINLMTYSKELDMFNAMAPVTKYPSFYYYREVVDWTFNKEYTILDKTLVGNSFVPFEQKYVGRIIVENQADAINVASELRFYWLKNPYLYVNVKDVLISKVKVGLRLLYIKIDEDRANDNKKGALRYVEFAWQSQLFFFDGIKKPFTEGINLYFAISSTDNAVNLICDDNLIKTFE